MASPYFYGNIIIGNTGTPDLSKWMSDAALGATTGPADMIGQVELNGGTFQVGANITAAERNFFLGGGSTIDVNGFTSTWGVLTDVQRTLEILNSNTSTKGNITFSDLTISATASLQLAGGAAGETVTFTNGIVRTGNDTLIIQPSSKTSLGTTEQVFSSGASTTLVNGIASVWIVENNDVSKSAGPYDFVTYGANGYVKATYTSTATLNSSTGSEVVALSGTATLTGDASVYALNTEGQTVALGGHTLTISDGTDAAGLILASGTSISNGTLAFGTSEGVIWLSGTNPTISSQITGTGGLTFSGSGTVAISTAANVTGAITIDSGTVNLTGANIFTSDSSGILLDNTKSKPAAASLGISANNTLDQLNAVGNNAVIALSNGAALTIGDAVNNFSSTISAGITETGAVTAGALTFDGSGLFDLSAGKITLVAGSTVVLNNSAQLRIVASELSGSTFGFVLNGTSQLQFAQNGGGQFANAVSGTGELHLIGGTLQLTGTNNSYSRRHRRRNRLHAGFDHRQVSTGGANITDAGGLIVFDQDFTGTYGGVISDGLEMGTGPVMSGSLDIDDSAATNASNNDVVLNLAQTYTGATYVEAGTLTLNAVNAIADSSGLTLGRVGGALDGQTAHLVLNADNAGPPHLAVRRCVEHHHGGAQWSCAEIGSDRDQHVRLRRHDQRRHRRCRTPDRQWRRRGDPRERQYVYGRHDARCRDARGRSVGVRGTGDITLSDPPTATTLKIDLEADPINTITGFNSTDTIDLLGFDPTTTSANMNYSTDVLMVTDGNGDSITLNFAGNFGGEFFHHTALTDSAGNIIGAAITESDVACYCFGTLIHTPRGRTRVENLKIGDKVKTASGMARPIKWIGKRSYGGRFILGQKDILPICIKAGALGDGVPYRDLWVSPHHAMYVEGVLIEARDLVNGVSIVQTEAVGTVEYFHIELDSHDVIIANGALSETFIDDDSRCMFHNVHEYAALYPDAQSPAAQAQYCAPRHHDGYAVEAARAHIAQRAGLCAASAPVGGLLGFVDQVGAKHITGWAQSADHPEAPVCLDIYVGGRLIGQACANRYREDLERAGVCSGCHSFDFALPAGLLRPDTIEVRRSLDGAALMRAARLRVRPPDASAYSLK